MGFLQQPSLLGSLALCKRTRQATQGSSGELMDALGGLQAGLGKHLWHVLLVQVLGQAAKQGCLWFSSMLCGFSVVSHNRV